MGGNAVHDGGARVDDRVEVRHYDIVVKHRTCAANLPVSDFGEVVEFERAVVVIGVRATQIELRVIGREFEGEDALANAALRDRRLVERWLSRRVIR